MTTMTKCVTPECQNERAPKSTKGYCRECSRSARARWVQTIQVESEARALRDKEFQDLVTRAHAAGVQAAEACTPRVMVVCTADGVPIERVAGGVCGFACVTIRPGNSPLANYLKKHAGAKRDYYGGVSVWISSYGQSMERKQAYAHAYAEVLQAAGFKAYANSRMD